MGVSATGAGDGGSVTSATGAGDGGSVTSATGAGDGGSVTGARVGELVGVAVLKSITGPSAIATKPSVAPTVFRELVIVGAELVREVVTDMVVAAVETE